METTYFNIETKRVVSHVEAGERASGGPETVCYPCAPQQKTAQPGGKVVDLEEYRRLHCVQEVSPVENPVKEPTPPRKHKRLVRLGLFLDLLATTGILLLVAGVLIKLFALS